MSAPKVITRELDLSTRVPSFPGVYIAIPGAFIKGPLEPTLCASDTDFLSKYTPNKKVETSFDAAYWTVLAAYQGSDSIWLSRAHNNALYGGISVGKKGGLFTNKIIGVPSQGTITVSGLPTALQSFNVGGSVFTWKEFGLITVTGLPVADQTFTIDDQTFTWKASGTSTGDVVIGADADGCAANLVTSITRDLTTVVATNNGDGTVSVVPVTVGSAIVFTDVNSSNVTFSGNGYLGGSSTGDVIIGEDADESAANIITSINRDLSTVEAFDNGDGVVLVEAVTRGTAGNSIVFVNVDSSNVAFDGTGYLGGYQTGESGLSDVETFPFSTDESIILFGKDPGAWNNALSAKLYNYLTQESFVYTAWNIADDTLTVTQDFDTGADFVIRKSGTSTLPAELAFDTTYYAIRIGATTIKLASTYANAMAGTPITLSGSPTGTSYIQPVMHCKEPPQTIDGVVTYAFTIEIYYNQVLVDTKTCSKSSVMKDGYGRSLFIESVLSSCDYIGGLNNSAVTETRIIRQGAALSFANGSNGGAVTDGNMMDALDLLKSKDVYPVTLVPDAGWTTPTYQRYITSFCETRDDCFALLGVPYSVEASSNYLNEIRSYRNIELNLNSSYAALYTPHVYIYDRYNDRHLYVSPTGYMAAVISKTASNYKLWFPPAGFKRGVLGLVDDVKRRYEEAEMDLLYDDGINCIRFAYGEGIVTWGQKTLLSRPSALDRINVRMLLIVIKPAISKMLEQYLFDPNDKLTRALVSSDITAYMDGILADEGVLDYKIICDESNNTASVIDNHEMNVGLLIKPMLSTEYINFAVAITRTGVDFKLVESAL